MAADRRDFAGLLVAVPFGIDWMKPISLPGIQMDTDRFVFHTKEPEFDFPRWVQLGAGQCVQRKSGPNYQRPSFYPGG
jgi:hypothetical protein